MRKNSNINKANNYCKAFTLVELAIVLIIIGLITGGVVGAQSLINSANRQSLVRSITDIKSAINAFKLEYDELPGVMSDAYDYFGDNCGGNNNDAATGCNSTDNDGCIDSGSGNCNFSWTFGRDMRRLFVHLNLSGIRPDIAYLNNAVSQENECREGIPSTSLSDGYFVYSESESKIYMFLFNYNTITASTYCVITRADALAPRDAKWLDQKIDDGNGLSGKVQPKDSMNDNAADGLCQNGSGVYALQYSDKGCLMRIEI